MKRDLCIPLLILLGLHLVAAQFNFFGNVFGGQHQQQQQRPGMNQWAAYSDSVSCSQYLCPQTLDCVARPIDCACPNAEDIKCVIPDSESSRGEGAVVCSRGKNDCSEVERLMRRGTQGKKK